MARQHRPPILNGHSRFSRLDLKVRVIEAWEKRFLTAQKPQDFTIPYHLEHALADWWINTKSSFSWLEAEPMLKSVLTAPGALGLSDSRSCASWHDGALKL